MKKIELTQGKYALVDDAWYEMLNSVRWYFSNDGYPTRTEYFNGSKVSVRMHHVILDVNNSTLIDHKDRKTLNTLAENLRLATVLQNNLNRIGRKKSSSKWKGVSKKIRGKPWEANICLNKTHYYLGRYVCEEDAAMVYNARAYELYGKYAYYNVSTYN